MRYACEQPFKSFFMRVGRENKKKNKKKKNTTFYVYC